MKLANLASAALVCVLAVATSGCLLLAAGVGAGAGVGAVAYKTGELVVAHKATIEQSSTAVEQGLTALKLPIVSKSVTGVGSNFVSREPDGAKIEIKVVPLAEGDGLTEIRIRVGTFGDEAMSRRIYTEIADHLPKS